MFITSSQNLARLINYKDKGEEERGRKVQLDSLQLDSTGNQVISYLETL